MLWEFWRGRAPFASNWHDWKTLHTRSFLSLLESPLEKIGKHITAMTQKIEALNTFQRCLQHNVSTLFQAIQGPLRVQKTRDFGHCWHLAAWGKLSCQHCRFFLIFLAMLGCCFLIYEMNLVFRVVEVFEHLLDILLEFARCLRMNSDSAWDGRGSGVAKWLGDQARLHSAGLSTCLGPHQEVGFALGKGTWWDLTRADRSTLRC